jgi:DNA-binding CsgD family transcriptional regulator
MSHIKKIIKNNITFTDSEAIKKLCEPLTWLGIHYFSYVHINSKNEMVGLCTEPEFILHYLDKGYQQYDLHRLPLGQNKKVVIWDNIELKNISKCMHNDFKDYGFGHTCTIVQQDGMNREYFNFATHFGKSFINKVYLEHLDKLERFICYFRDQMSKNKSLQSIYKVPLFINDAIGTYETRNELLDKNFEAFLRQTSVDRHFLNKESYLTKAEMVCLYWLSQGKTLEETAIILSLSSRTVKAHIHAAKTKLNCSSLFQLGSYIGTMFPYELEDLMD